MTEPFIKQPRRFFDLSRAGSPGRLSAALLMAGVVLICFCLDRRAANQAALAMLAATVIFMWGSGPSILKNFPGRKLNLAWALWILAGCASLMGALDIDYSLKAIRHDLLSPIILFYAAALLLFDERQVKIIWGAVLIGSLLLACSGIVNYVAMAQETPEGVLGSFGRIRTFGLEEVVHFYILRLFLSFPLWALAIYRAKDKTRRLLLMAGAAVVLTGWLLSYGRAQLLLLPLLPFLFLLVGRARPRQLNAFVATSLILSLGAVAYITLGDCILNRDDFGIRQFLWKVSANRIQENPWQGIGFGHVAYERLDVSQYLAGTCEQYLEQHHPHNLFLNIWLTTGLPGLLAMFCLVGMIYLTVLPAALNREAGNPVARDWARAFLISLILTTFINMSDWLLTTNNLDLLALMAGGAVASARMRRRAVH